MICQIEDQIAQPFSEIRVICILFKQFRIIGQNRQNTFLQRTVAFGSRFLFIAVAHGVFDSVHHGRPFRELRESVCTHYLRHSG